MIHSGLYKKIRHILAQYNHQHLYKVCDQYWIYIKASHGSSCYKCSTRFERKLQNTFMITEQIEQIDLIRTFSWVEIYVCRRRGNAAKFNTAIKLNCKRSIHSHYVWLPRNLHVKNTLFSGYFCGVCVLAKDFQISFFEAVFFSQCLAVMKFPKENDSILFIFIENFPSF